MKKPVSLLLSIALFSTSSAFAGEVETKVASAVATSYVQEQLKHQLANFLNNNPQVVFSSNPMIGTEGMRFLSQALSAYNLITAKTDRERAWSAAYLILAPEPTTALALFAAQMVDTLMSMKANRDLARIYEEIAVIRAKTYEIYSKLAIQDFNSQLARIKEFEKELDLVDRLQESVLASPLYQALQKNSGLETVTPDEIQAALLDLAQLRDALLNLDVATIYIEQLVRAEQLGLDATFKENCVSSNKSFDELRNKIDELQLSFFYFYGSLQTEQLHAKVRIDLQPTATRLRIYVRCVEIMNAASTKRFFGEKTPAPSQLNECQNRFQTKVL